LLAQKGEIGILFKTRKIPEFSVNTFLPLPLPLPLPSVHTLLGK